MAQKESLILRTASGEEYFVGIVDDFQHEIGSPTVGRLDAFDMGRPLDL